MLTQLSTVKARLGIPEADTTYDSLLTNAIKAFSARFDKECRRTLARTQNATYEFDPAEAELAPPGYPIESVAKWETKSSEAEGWQETTGVEYLLRSGCVISLRLPLNSPASALSSSPALARVTYTGSYVLPGTEPGPGQTPLPDDLEQACVEQVAFWFQTREHLGLKTYWPSGVAYQQFATFDLLEQVKAVLKKYTRWTM